MTGHDPDHVDNGYGSDEDRDDSVKDSDESGACATEDCDDTLDDGEGWNGYCGNCADRIYAAGRDDEDYEDDVDDQAERRQRTTSSCWRSSTTPSPRWMSSPLRSCIRASHR